MSDRPENAPDHCPGTQSEEAGKASACAGCPNQSICATAPKGPDPDIIKIKERMATVRHRIVVLSGKGGVGKSTVATQLAFTLAAQGYQVGLLDIDICGPSVPKMTGLEGEQVHQSATGWSPVYADENLAVMSIGFMLQDADQAVIWRGPRKNGMIKSFLKDVDWGELDVLLVDSPPGTSDEHLSIVTYLKEVGVDGAVVVTTPQEAALLDVRKEITFCRKVGLRVLGVLENMAGFVCPHCHNETQIFPPRTGGAARMCEQMAVPLMGRIPLDPTLRAACDQGRAFVSVNAASPASRAFVDAVRYLEPVLGPPPAADDAMPA